MSAQTHPDRLFERTPGGVVVLWLTALGVLSLVALLLSLGQVSGSRYPAALHGWLLTAGAALLLPVPFFTLDRLQAQRRVWLGRLAPGRTWQLLLAEHRQDLGLSWALIALPLMAWRGIGRPAAEAWPQTALAVGLTAAVLAALLGAALVTAAGLSGILQARWVAMGALGLTAVLAGGPELVAQAAEWGVRTSDAAGSASGPMAAVTCTWLLLGAALPLMALRQIEVRLAVWRPQQGEAPPSWWARLAAFSSRWSERWRLVDGPARTGSLWAVITQLPANLTNANPETRFLQPWDSTVTAGHLLRLAVMVVLALVSLRSVDMHWRVHLLPGGAGRRWLGLRIIGSTILAFVVPVAAVLAAIGLGLGLFVVDLDLSAWLALPGQIASYAAPFLVDLCLAVAAAAWLRGRFGEFGTRTWTITWIAITAIVVLALLSHSQSWPPLWTRGAWHHAAELALAACLAWLANRAWRKVDLGELLRRSASAKNER